MRTKQVQETVIYTCSKCGKTYNSDNISIEEISEMGLLLFEKHREGEKGNFLAKHLQGRTVLDFCSMECARQYVYDKGEIFLKEVTKRPTPHTGQLF